MSNRGRDRGVTHTDMSESDITAPLSDYWRPEGRESDKQRQRDHKARVDGTYSCVCVRAHARAYKRKTDRQTDRDGDRDRQTDGQTDKMGGLGRWAQRDRD